MTTDKPENKINEGELLPAKSKRMSVGVIDQYYIQAFLDNPSCKVDALRKAAEQAGIQCDTSRQQAGKIHRRLQHHIDRGLIKRIMEGATLGYSVLYKMAADENTGESNRLKAAALLIEYAGKNKPQNTLDNQRERVDILSEIKKTRLRIEQATGKPLT